MKRDTKLTDMEAQISALKLLVESMAARIALLEARPPQCQSYHYPPVISFCDRPAWPSTTWVRSEWPSTKWVKQPDTIV